MLKLPDKTCFHGANDSALITIKNHIPAFEIVGGKVFNLLDIPEMLTYPAKEGRSACTVYSGCPPACRHSLANVYRQRLFLNCWQRDRFIKFKVSLVIKRIDATTLKPFERRE